MLHYVYTLKINKLWRNYRNTFLCTCCMCTYHSSKTTLGLLSILVCWFYQLSSLSHTCCLDTPLALIEQSPRTSLELSSELSLLSRHLDLGCCHLASQEQACPSAGLQRRQSAPEEIASETKQWHVKNKSDIMTLKVWNWFNGEHPSPNWRQFPAHSCRGGLRQLCFSQRQDVLWEY